MKSFREYILEGVKVFKDSDIKLAVELAQYENVVRKGTLLLMKSEMREFDAYPDHKHLVDIEMAEYRSVDSKLNRASNSIGLVLTSEGAKAIKNYRKNN